MIAGLQPTICELLGGGSWTSDSEVTCQLRTGLASRGQGERRKSIPGIFDDSRHRDRPQHFVGPDNSRVVEAKSRKRSADKALRPRAAET